MATIKSQMVLNDGVSAVLKKITNALDLTLASFEQMQRASDNAVDVHTFEAMRGAIVGAANAADELTGELGKAAQEQERLNRNVNQGTSALDGMVKKAAALAGTYMSISGIKDFAVDSLKAADTQINAQIQLKTVLNNMGAEERYNTLVSELETSAPEAVLNLDTSGAFESYSTFTAGMEENSVIIGVQTDTTQASTAYEDILAKASEIQSKGIYGDEAMIAGAAEFATYFEDANAIMSMMDTLSDYAMGMSGGGALDTTAMVDYATNLGKIMSGSYDAMTKKGFEFSDAQKAIIEGTASEAQIVSALGAEYLDMSSDMQAAAAINSVIAEGWGGLYETMSGTPEGELIQLNNALGDIQETAGAGIYPAVLNFVGVFRQHLPQIEAAAMGFATVLGFVITLLTGIVEGAISFGTTVADNWCWIGPVVWGIVAALAVYAGYLAVMKAAQLAGAAAQWVMNSAFLASPITWVVIGIIALIAAVAALSSWIAKTTGAAQTGFGIITGGISVAIAWFKNLGFAVANIALGIGAAVRALGTNIKAAFHNAISKVQGWFYGLLSTALTVVAGICAALNQLPFVEFDYSGITDKAAEYAAKSAEAYGSEEDYTSIADAFNEGLDTYDAFADGWISDAFEAGADWGDGIMDKVNGFFDGLGYEPGSMEDYTFDTSGFDMAGIGSDVGDIADNTGGMAGALEVSGEELKYLRDIAERDAINRFTTAEVKIDMSGMSNRIEGGADLDGVIRELTEGFTEALVTAAEGVHE